MNNIIKVGDRAYFPGRNPFTVVRVQSCPSWKNFALIYGLQDNPEVPDYDGKGWTIYGSSFDAVLL